MAWDPVSSCPKSAVTVTSTLLFCAGCTPSAITAPSSSALPSLSGNLHTLIQLLALPCFLPAISDAAILLPS
ncbi:hypothetical protein HDV57DRAFT_504416 [Trichoderma longibrachiatum]